MGFILLVRHGQNEWVKDKRLAGWIPGISLNSDGRDEVKQLAERLSSLPIKMIYSSPLERCLETAEILAENSEAQVATAMDLGEVRYGKWEGKKLKKLAGKKKKWHQVQHYPSRFRFPKGESFVEVQDRAVTALEKLSSQHNEEIITIVSHADVIKLILAHYLGMHIDLFQRIVVAPASVSILALAANGSVQVVRVNDNGPITMPKHEKLDGNDRPDGEPEAQNSG